MQSSIRKLSALLLGACLLGLTSSARANYEYEVFDDGIGSGVVTVGTNSFSTASLTTTDFTLVIGSSTTAQSPTSTTVTSNLQAHLLATAVAGSHTLTLELVSTGNTMPTGPKLAFSTTASTSFSNANAGDSATFQTWGDPGNSSSFQTGTTGGQESASVAVGSTSSKILSPDPTTFTIVPSGAYAVSQTLGLTMSFEDAGSEGASVQGTTTISAVPAPSTTVFVISALPLLGLCSLLGLWTKRKLSAAA